MGYFRGAPVELVAEIYFRVSTKLGLPWLRDQLAALPEEEHWSRLAKRAMQDDLSALQRTVTTEVLIGGASIDDPQALIGAWQERNCRAIDRAEQLLGELRVAPTLDPAMFSVALRELRSLG